MSRKPNDVVPGGLDADAGEDALISNLAFDNFRNPLIKVVSGCNLPKFCELKGLKSSQKW